MQDFQGRTAVVTGGASGIGLAIARRLGREGMNLVLGDIEQPALDEAVAAFDAAGVPVLGIETDVSDVESVRRLAAAADQRFGNIHLLCNNAGVGGGGAILEPDDLDVWEWVLGVDLFGVLHGIKVFGPSMVAHGEPCHMVNTASMAGLVPTPGLGSYTVSKYAVVAMSETLSLETADTNLGVSVLCPGFVQTKIADSQRNIPEHLVRLEEPSEEEEFVRQAVAELISAGIAPEQVADDVVDAVRSGRFYILTHPEYAAQIRHRAEWIASGTAPSSWEI